MPIRAANDEAAHGSWTPSARIVNAAPCSGPGSNREFALWAPPPPPRPQSASGRGSFCPEGRDRKVHRERVPLYLSRPWSASDYQAFSDSLDKIIADGSLPIPRKGDKLSGPLVDRLVNDENLDLSRTANLPLGTRLFMANSIMGRLPAYRIGVLRSERTHQKLGTVRRFELFAYMLSTADRVLGAR